MPEMDTYANAMHMMTRYEMHDKDKNTRIRKPNNEESHNLVPEMARVGIQIWQVTYGVLQHSTTTKGSHLEI